jgi:LacI family transcriptional regulator
MQADTVLLDDAGGARAAVEHLLARGHRRIACVADRAEVYTARERMSGYEAALEAAGVAVDPELIRPGSQASEQAERVVGELLDLPPDRRPTAIFSANNRNTIGALHALAGREDGVALIGFDDFELADLLGITVVRADAARLGAEAAKLAFARLDGDERPPQRVTIPTTIVGRGSGERAA